MRQSNTLMQSPSGLRRLSKPLQSTTARGARAHAAPLFANNEFTANGLAGYGHGVNYRIGMETVETSIKWIKQLLDAMAS